ncbi:MAG: hypothetical protein N3A54_06345 [Patescibacteria group bacterium]|nr:hypothetical protein [Patescibacteria group bacterium]
MKKKISKKFSINDSISRIIIYTILFLLLVLASISWIQYNTQPKNFAQDATPTVTPMLRCDSPCAYNAQCPSQLFCYNGSCRNPSCKDAVDCTCVLTPTPDPSVPTATSRPVRSTPTRVVSPTQKISPSIIVIISPYPTPEPSPEPSPTPMFEIDKEVPKKRNFFDTFLDFIANLFCRIFRC